MTREKQILDNLMIRGTYEETKYTGQMAKHCNKLMNNTPAPATSRLDYEGHLSSGQGQDHRILSSCSSNHQKCPRRIVNIN